MVRGAPTHCDAVRGDGGRPRAGGHSAYVCATHPQEQVSSLQFGGADPSTRAGHNCSNEGKGWWNKLEGQGEEEQAQAQHSTASDLDSDQLSDNIYAASMHGALLSACPAQRWREEWCEDRDGLTSCVAAGAARSSQSAATHSQALALLRSHYSRFQIKSLLFQLKAPHFRSRHSGGEWGLAFGPGPASPRPEERTEHGTLGGDISCSSLKVAPRRPRRQRDGEARRLTR
eukprot:TRINITY_DN441_c0_g2_i3.p2 TRINITY_DN441_c0_g2~~TRINITY_DN441_c0_g2_i3.p2  ORF type:complete len:230 (-),score=10.67 TRINITY_DN441_c0_g2_i3:289-978(-)